MTFKIDKEDWIEYGTVCEGQFVERVSNLLAQNHIKSFINPEKLNKPNGKYAYDLCIQLPCDLKTRTTVFWSSEKHGFKDYEYVVTLDVHDINRYNKIYPHLIIIFDVRYANPKKKMHSGVYYTPMERINQAIKTKKAKYHQRGEKGMSNNKDCYLFDVRWFTRVHNEI